jgi:uncharacterized protein (DUF1499 family)
MFKRLIVSVLLLALAVIGFGSYRTLTPPGHLYYNAGVFGGCPKRPSCVSSLATDDMHRVAALGYSGDSAASYVMLKEVVERMGGKIEHEKEGYIHAVFLSEKLELRDDLELLMLPDGHVDVRSISRFSYDDRGANRARVEQLRQAFEAMP